MKARMLVLCLLILFTFPAWSEPLTPEQVVSSIEPTKWYLGSDVRDAMSQVLVLAQESIQTTSEDAVRAATVALVTSNTQLATESVKFKAQRDLYGAVAGVEAGLLITAAAIIIVFFAVK